MSKRTLRDFIEEIVVVHAGRAARPHVAYKVDSKGKARGWMAYGKPDGNLFQISGILDSENFVTSEKHRPGKNIGKSNETTPEQQSWLEAASLHKKKLDKDYFTTLEEAKNTTLILPMLAESYDKHSDKIDWSGDVFVQPKLDGMRCLAICSPINGSWSVKLISRQGHDLIQKGYAVDHIVADVVEMVTSSASRRLTQEEDGTLVFDGELYADALTFQEAMSAIKKRKKTSALIKFHVYDFVDVGFEYRFGGRHSNLEYCFEYRFGGRYSNLEYCFGYSDDGGNLELVNTFRIEDEEALKYYHADFLGQGYEGSIVRHGNDPYKLAGRSKSLLKYKDFVDLAVEIVDVEPTDSRPEHGTPVCVLDDGREFRCGTKLSHEQREELLANKDNYIGKTAEIRFFEWTDDLLPRFPVFIGLRLDK